MLLEIATTPKYANDLGNLLHKHPGSLKTVELAVGSAHVFYSDRNKNICTVCLLVDINPNDLVRNSKHKNFLLQQDYVNDRPYTSNSFLSSAIARVFGSALNGACRENPELVHSEIPLIAKIHALKVDADKNYIEKLFAPLGYKFSYEIAQLDSNFPSWGESKIISLTIEKTTTVKELLSHLYILIMVLDNDRHYWITKSDIDVLMEKGANWLEKHPEKEWITKRYLKNLSMFTNQALLRLTSDTFEEHPSHEKVNLHQLRLTKAFDLLKTSGAESVLDIGCGEGKLLKMLLKEGQFKKIQGTDVSFNALQKAKETLGLDQGSFAMKERISIFQSSVTYKDQRMKNFDAVALIEVIEHLDEERLSTMKSIVFDYIKPNVVVLTTPNAEYNTVFEKLHADSFRHHDHRFEWTRSEFSHWCNEICSEFTYEVTIYPIGPQEENKGTASQCALFKRK